ncbi:MAG: hypothetical protein JXR26_09895 [Balneolaceae bacterium]|nr:hypothetical protein [Balneolaceae bacterium]
MSDYFKDKLKKAWQSLSKKSNEEAISGIGREKIIVFCIALILAFSIWLVVNLNRDYSIEMSVPIVLGNISTDRALAEELPDEVTASVSGDGWSLINVYQSPPEVYIDVTQQRVNLFEQIRQQMSTNSEVTVQTVDPLSLQLNLEPKQSKKVPVISNVSVEFVQQYGFLAEPVVDPDSIIVQGAASRIQNINQWPTESLQLTGINENISQEVALKKPASLITLSQTEVQYRGEVAEFTEAEVTVPIETRDFPANLNVTFSPSSVNIKYQIPLQEYVRFKDSQPFAAYVTYAQIQQDTSGFVDVQVEKLLDNAHLNLRKTAPAKVAYFTIIGN